jgi:hypothetical protein
MIPNTTSIADAWQELEQAAAAFLEAMQRAQSPQSQIDDKLLIGDCMRVLGKHSRHETLRHADRQEARGLYIRCRRSMGIDDAT